MTKPCKFCYTNVHLKAKICPKCLKEQTLYGISKGILMTFFPAITALASLGLAYYEKHEKDVVKIELADEKLNVAAATNLAEDLSQSLSDSQLVTSYAGTFGTLPTEERLASVDEKLRNAKAETALDKSELSKLKSEKLMLDALKKRTSRRSKRAISTLEKPATAAAPGSFRFAPDLASPAEAVKRKDNRFAGPPKQLTFDGKTVTPLIRLSPELIQRLKTKKLK